MTEILSTDQIHKQRPLQDFVSDDQNVLVCTDIASRGIDCSKVSHHMMSLFMMSSHDACIRLIM